MRRRRRALVLGDEAARHPFRQSLPPHVCKGPAQSPRSARWPQITAADWKGFLAAYGAAFLAVSLFIY